MNILDFLRGRETFETRAMDASTFNLGLDDEGKTASGKSVDAGTAVQASTVYACVSLIADSVATMPVHSYRKTGDFREQTTAPLEKNLPANSSLAKEIPIASAPASIGERP